MRPYQYWEATQRNNSLFYSPQTKFMKEFPFCATYLKTVKVKRVKTNKIIHFNVALFFTPFSTNGKSESISGLIIIDYLDS